MAWEGTGHPCTSVNSEEEGGMMQKSEVPLSAMNTGNAEGAKGCRFEITGEGRMTQHRVDYVHDTIVTRFTQKARAEPETRFTALMGLLCESEVLHASFARQNGKKAAGVDGISKADYEVGLTERMSELSVRLRGLSYRPTPVRRVYIPKGDGRYRPLGVPCFEGRIVQDRASMILQAIWEPIFLDCSYGFRPGRGAHDALRWVTKIITKERTQWVVEADIKGFFEHVRHEDLLRFRGQRIVDPIFKRVLRRSLKAGVMKEGKFSSSDIGTPQGGLVSPVLSNIYLH